jgi:hypothetical protein
MGEYEYRIRMQQPRIVDEAHMLQQNFATVIKVVDYLVNNYNGTVEQTPVRVGVPEFSGTFESSAEVLNFQSNFLFFSRKFRFTAEKIYFSVEVSDFQLNF